VVGPLVRAGGAPRRGEEGADSVASVHLGALVFDFDGLIADTESVEYEAIRRVFAEHGATLPLYEWLPVVGSHQAPQWMDWLEARVGHPLDRTTLAAARRRHADDALGELTVKPGVIDLLDAADAAGVPCAIASNSPRSWVGGLIEDLHLGARFAAVISVDVAARPKPAPDPYLQACAAVDAAPSCSVAFEDSYLGVTSAVAAGLYTVAVPGPMSVNHDLTAADAVVTSLADVTLPDLAAAVQARRSIAS
jgi:HAD superfamily hydrolase (TIGR01509 family)